MIGEVARSPARGSREDLQRAKESQTRLWAGLAGNAPIIADSSRMRIIAFHFMSRVRRSQRFVSGYVVVRLAQLRLVERVWDQCESRVASGPASSGSYLPSRSR